jgi:hypothetical protein
MPKSPPVPHPYVLASHDHVPDEALLAGHDARDLTSAHLLHRAVFQVGAGRTCIDLFAREAWERWSAPVLPTRIDGSCHCIGGFDTSPAPATQQIRSGERPYSGKARKPPRTRRVIQLPRSPSFRGHW